MSGPRELFSWDDRSDEVPIPLVETMPESSGGVDPIEAVVDEAEIVVREAQAALGQDDTEPAFPMPLLAAAPSRVATRHSTVGPKNLLRRRPLRLIALVAACALAFAHGWHQGSTASSPDGQARRGVTQGV